MDESHPVRIAIIGPGAIGREHAGRLKRSNRAELAGFVHPKGRAIHGEGLNHVYCATSIQELMQNTKVDAVIIASPTQTHIENMRSCLKLRLPTLVEKPLSADLYSALKLYHDDKGIQDIVLVGHHRLFSPIVDATCQVLEKKALGKIVCVRGSSKFFKPASYFEAQAWRVVEGGGPLNINFVHDIASMIRILGQISLVHAFSSNHARNFTVEDTAVVNMVFKNGVLGSFVISDCAMSTESWEQTSGENQYFWNDVDSDCYEISGTKASIKIPSMTFIGPSEGQPESWNSVVDKGIFAVSSEDPLERQLQHFIDVIQKKAKPRVSFRFGCEVVAVTHAIRHSISTGCAAEVPTLFL